MASPNCTNTDISGIGVRSATYAQNLLSFVPAAVALLNDGKISNNEREFIKDQSTNVLLTAFGLLLSAIIQAKTNQGLDNYHLALVLNLSWMNNTNTFIYFVLFLHRKIWNSPPGKWSWRAVVPRLFRQPSKPTPEDVEVGISPQQQPETTNQSAQEEPESLLDSAVWIGSLHLSLMGGVGIWLWSNPVSFGTSLSCPANATISVIGRSLPVASPGLRIISLIFYAAVLIPIVNLLLPTAFIFIPYFIGSLVRWSDPKNRESVAVRCVALGLILLFAINIIFITDTELAISRNESRQAGQDTIWTLGQTLALLLLILPIRGLIKYLLTTTSWVLPFLGETQWGRAVRVFREYDKELPWSDVYRCRWLLGDTPVKVNSAWLMRAHDEGQLGIVRFLCENGADWLALVDAATQGDLEIVCLYLTRDMDINYLLDLAATNGHLEIVRFLVEKGADVNGIVCWPLRTASENGHLDIVRFLVEKGADVNGIGGWPFRSASLNGHLEIVCFLVDKGVDVDSEGGWALCIASRNGHLEIVRFLVEKGADINSACGMPLCFASINGHLEIVRFLVEKGADINIIGGSPLCLASKNGHLEIVRFLVEKGADVNSPGRNTTPLDLAVKYRHAEIVSFLRDNGGIQTGRIRRILTAIWEFATIIYIC